MDTNADLPPFDPELLTRVLAGHASLIEQKIIERWTAEHPQHAMQWACLEEAWRAAEGRQGDERAKSEVLVQAVLNRIAAQRCGPGNDRQGVRKIAAVGQRAMWQRAVWRRALPAGIAGLVALMAMVWLRNPKRDFGVTRTYTTAIGQRATLLLNDGTRVMMAPQTTLRLVRFGRSARTLVLDGDAYFEVSPSTHTPFIVRAGTTTTRVLGTAFEVRHYSGGSDVRVAVATGKVLVSSGTRHPAVTVTAEQVALLNDSTQVVKSVDNIDTEIGWLGDRLVFQNAPITKVLATLARWYGYQFRYADSTVARQMVTVGLSMRSSTEALATLEQLLDVSLTIAGDTVTLTPVHVRTAPNQRTKRYDMWVPTREVGR
jgi:transmembrane sensor